MRVLLDECVPRFLRRRLQDHAVLTVGDMGWHGASNGTLLRLARGRFDVLVTVDQRLPAESDVLRSGLGVIVVHARTTDSSDLNPLVPALLDALSRVAEGVVLHVRR